MSPSSETADEDYPDTDLTPKERKRLRQIMEADKRARWFWITFRTWTMWIVGTSVAITAGYQALKDVIKALAR